MTAARPGSARLRLAIIGYGWWGQHMLRRLRASEIVEPALVVETAPALLDKAKAEGAAVIDDFTAALADPAIDGVILTVPNALHEAYSCLAAAAGKHVFCEKPLALDPEAAARIVAACAAAGVVLGIGHERRFEPAMLRLKQMVAAGEFGTIMHAEAAFSHDKLIGAPAGDWRTLKATSPAAGMTAMGIHLSDLMIWLLGRVETVSALTARRVLTWETGDVVTAQFGFEAGMTASLSAVLYTPHFMRFQIFGHKRWAEVRNSTHPDTPGGIAELVIAETGQPQRVETFDWTDTVRANVEAWAAKCLTGAGYIHTTDEMHHNIEVLAAVAAAAETRSTVRLRTWSDPGA